MEDSSPKVDFLILYGTETGQAEAIAEKILEDAKSKEFKPVLHCLNKINKDFVLEDERCVVMVVSTTGDGEIPEQARKFWRLIKRRSDESAFKNLGFSLLALGDTNYTNFCNSGKQIESKLCELGADKFYPTGYADDGTGLETVVEPWIDGLWDPLSIQLHKNTRKKSDRCVETPPIANIKERNNNVNDCKSILIFSKVLSDVSLSVPALSKSFLGSSFAQPDSSSLFQSLQYFSKLKLPSTSSNLGYAKYVSGRYITKNQSIKRTIEVTLDLSDTDIEFGPGDAIGVLPINDTEEVNKLLNRLNLHDRKDDIISFTSTSNKALPAHLNKNLSLFDFLKYGLEIRAPPKKAFLRHLAEYTSDSSEKRRLLELSSRQGAEEYQKHIRGSNICLLDILTAFSTCQPNVNQVFENLPHLSPRFYSAVNGPGPGTKTIKLALNVIEFTKDDGRCDERLGVCSGFLEKIVIGSNKTDLISKLEGLKIADINIPVYLRSNANFRPPSSLQNNIIMIGPGTGVAPFIGFLEQRQNKLASNKSSAANVGKSWLFFGCRHKKRDFIYEDELMGFCGKNTLEKLFVSFSRDDTGPKYVQDNILHHKTEFVELLFDSDTYVYVCGDAKGMAKSVYNCITSVVKEIKGMSSSDAEQYILQLQKGKRYLQDIWS